MTELHSADHHRSVSADSPLREAMIPRSPDEPHRAATPLELIFDLVFVDAIAHAANGRHPIPWGKSVASIRCETCRESCGQFYRRFDRRPAPPADRCATCVRGTSRRLRPHRVPDDVLRHLAGVDEFDLVRIRLRLHDRPADLIRPLDLAAAALILLSAATARPCC
jgi:hypothetical protein